jgi:hypothetical protein
MFCVIIEYKGGTFVHQLHSSNVLDALKQTFTFYSQIEEYKEYFDEKLMTELDLYYSNNLGPVLLEGMSNIWHFAFRVGKSFGHCHLVKMESA